MAAWCFWCDAPVEGGTCPACGRPSTPVEDGPVDEVPWFRRVPQRTWVLVAVAAVVVLYTLFQSGFRLVD